MKPRIWPMLRQRGWKLVDLAHRIEMDPAQLSKYASGRKIPSVPVAQRIARGLGSTTDEVFPASEAA